MRPGQGPQTQPEAPQLRAGLEANSWGSQKSQLDTII